MLATPCINYIAEEIAAPIVKAPCEYLLSR